MSVVRSHSLSIGIVGLPNAGKSTLFNSLTENEVPAENFPFCTIDKNVGIVQVPDPRLEALEKFFDADKTVPSAIKFVDIAGLVKGASKGEGLGNQFLSHIREVDVIMYVLRSFKSETISHVYERISPSDDIDIVQSELILKDLETVDKKLSEIRKRAKSTQDKEVTVPLKLYEKLMEEMEQGKPAIEITYTEEELPHLKELWLLTNKKRMYVLNVRQGTDEAAREEWMKDLSDFVGEEDSQYILQADVKSVGEMSAMSDSELGEYLELLGDEKPVVIDDVINMAFDRLGLLTFYTGSEKEVNAWSIGKGATAKQAAGVIHTDLAKGFITADVVNVEKFVEVGGMAAAKEKGLVRNVGKEHVTQDGDYMIIFANN